MSRTEQVDDAAAPGELTRYGCLVFVVVIEFDQFFEQRRGRDFKPGAQDQSGLPGFGRLRRGSSQGVDTPDVKIEGIGQRRVERPCPPRLSPRKQQFAPAAFRDREYAQRDAGQRRDGFALRRRAVGQLELRKRRDQRLAEFPDGLDQKEGDAARIDSGTADSGISAGFQLFFQYFFPVSHFNDLTFSRKALSW